MGRISFWSSSRMDFDICPVDPGFDHESYLCRKVRLDILLSKTVIFISKPVRVTEYGY